MELIIAMTYGRALFDAAKDLDKIDEIKRKSIRSIRFSNTSPSLWNFSALPAIPAVKKKGIIRNVFEGRVCDEVLSFMYILVDKSRFYHYHWIVKEYLRLMDEYRGEAYRGRVYSAAPLSAEQIEKLEG